MQKPFTISEYEATREAVRQQVKTHIPSRERLLQIFPSLDKYDYHFKISIDMAMAIVGDLFHEYPELMLDNIAAAPKMNVLHHFDLNYSLAQDLGDELIRTWVKNASLHCLIMKNFLFISPTFSENQLADQVLKERAQNIKAQVGSRRP